MSDTEVAPAGETAVQPALFEVDDPGDRPELPEPILLAFLGGTAVLLTVAASLGMIGWLGVVFGVIALTTSAFRPTRWAAAAAVVATLLFGGVGLASSHTAAPDASNQSATASASSDSVVSEDNAGGSLGVHLAELPTLWNGVTQGAQITRGIIKSPEAGALDAFYYHFGGDAYVAGAYDPSSDLIHALVTSAPVSDPTASSLYLHLCFILHPYSPECIDAYQTSGLGEDDLAVLAETGQQSRWDLGTEEWRLHLSAGVLTIRVLGEVPG